MFPAKIWVAGGLLIICSTVAETKQSKHGTGGTVMFDGKWDAKEATECWVIKNRKNGNVVFSYRTHRGNEKKALFTAAKYAEEALNKYIRNPENYYISII